MLWNGVEDIVSHLDLPSGVRNPPTWRGHSTVCCASEAPSCCLYWRAPPLARRFCSLDRRDVGRVLRTIWSRNV